MLFGAVRPVLATSLVLFSIAAWVSGGRTLISSMFGLSRRRIRQAAMALRAASMQFGYFIGTFAAGVALRGGRLRSVRSDDRRALPVVGPGVGVRPGTKRGRSCSAPVPTARGIGEGADMSRGGRLPRV